MSDEHDLSRFVEAQRDSYDRVLAELEVGEKRSHWMWFVFPQIAGLGFSATAQRYAIASLAEARAYLAHPILGPRLLACTEAVTRHQDRSARRILGSPDDLKLRSSLTLFAEAAPDLPVFAEALAIFYGGERDAATLDRLHARADPGRV